MSLSHKERTIERKMEKGGGKVRESWKKGEQVSSRSGDATKGKIKNAKGDSGEKVAREKGRRNEIGR